MPGIIITILMLFFCCDAATAGLWKNDLLPDQLRCEYLVNPAGVDTGKPRLSWIIAGSWFGSSRGERQTAYQVLVASSLQLLRKDRGDLWDSGKVISDQCVHVEYSGKPLQSRQRCYWKVRIWDEKGEPASWSKPSEWQMGLLAPDDFKGKWIRSSRFTQDGSPSPWLRKSFELESVPKQALVQVESHGYHELWVNGRKVGSAVLTPAVSVLKKRTFCVNYEIGPMLRKGRNTVGLWLGRGWNVKGIPGVTDERPVARFNGQCVLGEQTVEINSDESWVCAQSPYSTLGPWKWNNYVGELYDARLENPGWCDSSTDDSAWQKVEIAGMPAARTISQMAPLNRIGKRISPLSCKAIDAGAWEIDFGSNLTGWLMLRMPSLVPGRKIIIHYADRKYKTPAGDDTPAGKIGVTSQKNFKKPGGEESFQTFSQRDEFISAGKGKQSFCSKFNYHGFRYVVIEGLPAKPALNDVEALLVESDLETTGSFECSNELFNRIHQLNVWTIRSLNLGGYLVDCPHRERLGYGDGQVSVETCIMNWRMPVFYEKWIGDWVDVQDPLTGALPFSTPYHEPAGANDFGKEGPPGWGGALPAIAWRTYLYYGDRRILETMIEPMKRFVERIESFTTNGIFRGYGNQWQQLGDWVPPNRGMDTSNWPPARANELFNNCYRIYLWELLEKSFGALGRDEEVRRCHEKIDQVRPLIHQEFFKSKEALYGFDEQAYQVMPLMAGIVPEDLRPAVLKKLEDGIMVRCKGHLDTGMLGTYFMIQYLSQIGRDDLVYTIMNQTAYPGWGYMLEQGATTMWEQWNGYWSQIHSCFTCPDGWFYQALGGIRADESGSGFKKIIIKPAVIGDITWVKCSYGSIYGCIVSNWKLDGNKLAMDVTIPPNTTATVYVPAKDAEGVMESGRPASKAKCVKLLRVETNKAVFEVGSGCYRFESEMLENRGNRASAGKVF